MGSDRLSDRGPVGAAGAGSSAAVDPPTIDRGAEADAFLRLFEHSPDLLCVAGFDGRFRKLNPAWERTLGWTREELCSRPWLDFVHPEDRAATIAAGEMLVAGRLVYDFENRYLCRDGSWRWLSWHSFPLPAERRIYAVARDVTGPKSARRELERIQWLLRPGRVGDTNVYEPPYGDAAATNPPGLILRSVGREMLRDIVRDFLELLGTSAAVYERNGDYALGIFASGYCRLLDERSFHRCGAGDVREAVAGGRWRCHESCWNRASRVAIATDGPAEGECEGGIRLYALPIRAGGEVVGSINFGYGDPPRDAGRLGEIAAKYGIPVQELRRAAESYETRPPFIIELARSRLASAARFIGTVVERWQAERRTQTLLARQEAMLAAIPDIVAEVNVDRVYTWMNRAGLEFFGEDAIGKEASYFFESRQSTYRTVQPLFDGYEEVIYVESLQRRRDGRPRLLAWWCRVLKDAEGRATGALSTARDITEQREAERELQESRQRMELALFGADLGTWDWDVAGGRVTFNERWAGMLGYELAEIRPDVAAWEERIHPEDRPAVMAALERHLRGETPAYETEHRLRHRSGRWIWVLDKGRVIERDASGKPLRVCGTHLDITDRKTAEEAERLSTERLRLAMEAANEGLWDWSVPTGEAFFSPRWYTMLGYVPNELPPGYATWLELLHPEDRERAVQTVQRAVAERRPMFEMECRLRCKDGGYRWILARGRPVAWDAQGAVTRLIGTHVDISALKETQERLLAAEGRFRALFENMSEGVAMHELICDAHGRPVNYRITEVNPRFAEMTGLAPGQVVGKPAHEAYGTPEPPYLERFCQVGLTGVPCQFETCFPPMDRHFFISAAPLGPGRFATIFFDITARRLAEEAQARLTAIIESTSELVSWAYPDGRLAYINEAGRRMLGWGPDADVAGRRIADLHPAWAAERILGQGIPAAMKRGSWEGETAVLGPEGREIPVSQLILVHRAADRELKYMSTVMRDISERKRAEQEREALLRELSAKNQELESLLYAASHDLRSPLVNIQGFTRELQDAAARLADLLKSGGEAADLRAQAGPLIDEVMSQAVSYITASGQKMSALLDGLLKVCRLGRTPLNLRVLDMNALLAGVTAALEYQVRESGGRIDVEPLPPCLGDAGQINQVFTNLLDNALKYRDPGRPPSVRVSGRLDGREAVYCVQDNGVGIGPAHQEKIWELFHRLDPRGGVPGEGVGLPIVRRIVQRHNGRVWVESEPGRGSGFFVALAAVR